MKLIYYTLAACLVMGLTSCPKTVDKVPIPNRGASDLSGHIRFLDEFQQDSIASSGITGVIITAVAVGGTTSYTATYDAGTGNFNFPALPAGKYAITYKADGFADQLNPTMDHPGGDPQNLGKAVIYKPSTTQVLSLSAVNNAVVTSISYSLDYTLRAGDSLKVAAGDTVKFHIPVTATTNRDSVVFYPDAIVLKFISLVNLSQVSKFVSVDKSVIIKTKTDSTNRPNKPYFRARGAQLYFSDVANPGPSNYKMLVITDGAKLDSSSYTIKLPLQQFVDAGILVPGTNQTVYITAYGKSGDKAWYGTQEDPNNKANLIFPGINLTAGQNASTSLLLDLP